MPTRTRRRTPASPAPPPPALTPAAAPSGEPGAESEPVMIVSHQGDLIPYSPTDRRVWAVAIRHPERLSLVRLLEVLVVAAAPTGRSGRSALNVAGLRRLTATARERWEAAGRPGEFPAVECRPSRHKVNEFLDLRRGHGSAARRPGWSGHWYG